MKRNGTILGAIVLGASLALLSACSETTSCNPASVCGNQPEVAVTGSWGMVGRCDQPTAGLPPEVDPGCPAGWEESCFRLALTLTESRGRIGGTGVMTRTGRTSTACQETGQVAPIAVRSGSHDRSGISFTFDVGGLGLGGLAFDGDYLAQFGDSMFGHRNPNLLAGVVTGAGFHRYVVLYRG